MVRHNTVGALEDAACIGIEDAETGEEIHRLRVETGSHDNFAFLGDEGKTDKRILIVQKVAELAKKEKD